ncbi:DedA family protein [Patescibacteria group bacterium]|nr:DedA family protein [Patescibacteria group bacterium]
MIFTYLDNLKIKWRDWFIDHAYGTHAKAWLFLFSFSESIFFIFPPSILLIAILMIDATRWVYYALLTTVASVLGAILGYIIGAFFFDLLGVRIIEFYNLFEQMEYVRTMFDKNTFVVIFTAAFTPIPFKVFVLSAGFFKVNFAAYLLASILGRGARYFLVAYLTKKFGSKMAQIIFKYFNIITLVVVLIALLILLEYQEFINLFPW